MTTTKPNRPTCHAPECSRAVYARSLCERHYRQVLRRGAVSPERPAPASCAVADCPRQAVTRGWCHAHYLRWVRTGTVRAQDGLRPPERRRCRLPACDEPHDGHGYCRSHLNRVRQFGDPRSDVPFQTTGTAGWVNHGYRYVPVPFELRHLSGGAPKLAEHRLVMAIVLACLIGLWHPTKWCTT